MSSKVDVWAGARGIEASSLPKTISGLLPVEPWSSYPHLGSAAAAAVVLLFVPSHESELRSSEPRAAQLVFTRRSLSVRTHKGQMGFPGGRVEPGDLTPADTAVRELEEELGVAREAVKVHGLLPPQAALDGRPVAAVIATAAINKKDFVPSPDEVDAVFLGSWEHFRRQNDQAFEFNAFGNWRLSHLFTLSDFRVWGLTAKILFDADLR